MERFKCTDVIFHWRFNKVIQGIVCEKDDTWFNLPILLFSFLS